LSAYLGLISFLGYKFKDYVYIYISLLTKFYDVTTGQGTVKTY